MYHKVFFSRLSGLFILISRAREGYNLDIYLAEVCAYVSNCVSVFFVNFDLFNFILSDFSAYLPIRKKGLNIAEFCH